MSRRPRRRSRREVNSARGLPHLVQDPHHRGIDAPAAAVAAALGHQLRSKTFRTSTGLQPRSSSRSTSSDSHDGGRAAPDVRTQCRDDASAALCRQHHDREAASPPHEPDSGSCRAGRTCALAALARGYRARVRYPLYNSMLGPVLCGRLLFDRLKPLGPRSGLLVIRLGG